MSGGGFSVDGLFEDSDFIDDFIDAQTHPTTPDLKVPPDHDPAFDHPSTTSRNGLKFKIIDTFTSNHSNSLLYGKTITGYAKAIITRVIDCYHRKGITGDTDVKRLIINHLNEAYRKGPVTFDTLMKHFDATTVECLLGYMLIAFQDENIDLILKTTYTFGRVLPLERITEWFDNYRLNAYGNVLNLIQYAKFDSPNVYTVDYNPEPIDESVDVNDEFFDKAVRFKVGSLRAFIIDNDLYPDIVCDDDGNVRSEYMMVGGGMGGRPRPVEMSPTSMDMYAMQGGSKGRCRRETSKEDEERCIFTVSGGVKFGVDDVCPRCHRVKCICGAIPEQLLPLTRMMASIVDDGEMTGGDRQLSGGGGGNGRSFADQFSNVHRRNQYNVIIENKTPKQICDEAYLRYPFMYCGAHGCDVFSSTMSMTVEEIDVFLKRYPSAHVGYILNTATYASGRGEHWVAVDITRGYVKLVCSQASDFSVFNDQSFVQAFERLGYKFEWNKKSIQRDHSSCGMFSAMSLMMMLRFNGDIEKTVDAIGSDMKTLGALVGKRSDARTVIEKLAGASDTK